MKYYVAPNLSEKAKEITGSFFGMLAKLSETFVFIYMGVAMFLEQQSWHDYNFTFFTILSIFLARVLNVFPLSYIVNRFRPAERQIPLSHQIALWFGGLRGAMAFALALQSVADLPDNHGRVLLTSSLFTILFTVLTIGGSTPYMLRVLNIECHGPDYAPEQDRDGPNKGGVADEDIDLEEDKELAGLKVLAKQKARLKKKLQKLKKETSFANIDKKYLTPFFGVTPNNEEHANGSRRKPEQQHMEEIEMTIRSNASTNLILEAVPSSVPLLPPPAPPSREHRGSLSRRSSIIPL